MDGIAPARVHLHDGLGGRVATLTTASSINRAWAIMQPTAAQITIALDDPAVRQCDPRLGRVVVIESEQYAVPWVGGIQRADGSESAGTVTLACLSLDAVLRDRYLPAGRDPDAQRYAGSAGSVFARVLEDANGANASGIGVSPDVSVSAAYRGAFPDRSVYGSLNALAQQTGHEWWVDYTVTPAGITATARLAPARGRDLVERVLSAPGNAEVLQSGIDMGGSIFATTVVGGHESTLQAYTERERVTKRRDGGAELGGATVAAAATVHGYEIEHADLGQRDLTRREAVLIAENLRDRGAVDAAAEVLAGNRRSAERVLQLRLTSHDRALWSACEVGNVVRVRAPRAFLGLGLDAPVRLVSVQPMEEAGDLVLVGQVLKDRGGR